MAPSETQNLPSGEEIDGAPEDYVYEPFEDIPVEAFVSPAFDESVIGYSDDIVPDKSGVGEMLAVVRLLENENIPCCMVGESALIYFGTGRMRNDWVICVPTDRLEEAASILRSREEEYVSFQPSAMKALDGMHHLYPRFKCVGLALFFVLTTSQECHLPCFPENFERSSTGIPYPKLSVYAQSLLDTYNLVDLDDLVDGMNLSIEWGDKNLNLEGSTDVEWGKWKWDTLQNAGTPESRPPYQITIPNSRREIWIETASAEQKRKWQGWKVQENRPTLFWREDQKDPRLRTRDNC